MRVADLLLMKSGSRRSCCTSAAVIFTQSLKVGETWKQKAGYSR